MVLPRISSTNGAQRLPALRSELDLALVAQFVVAWAGESGEERRLGWWRSDLTSEFGGHDLFQQLLPQTWRWAALQGAREAARRRDAELRRKDHNPDRLLSLFHLGFEVDEQIEQRMWEHKQSGSDPAHVLPGLALISSGWSPDEFWNWVFGHGDAVSTAAPAGRLIPGDPPSTVAAQIPKLVAALAPVSTAYPLPHFRRAP